MDAIFDALLGMAGLGLLFALAAWLPLRGEGGGCGACGGGCATCPGESGACDALDTTSGEVRRGEVTVNHPSQGRHRPGPHHR